MTPKNGGSRDEALRIRIRQRLADLEWTQEQLADAIGETEKNVSRWLTTTRIPAAFLAGFVQKVPVNPEWLLTGVGDPDPPDRTKAERIYGIVSELVALDDPEELAEIWDWWSHLRRIEGDE
jgi:transcriptional regulator with XRE-family HTH domain